MSNRYAHVVVLCEDSMHYNFVRRYLIEKGVERSDIFPRISPAGRGAGSQYVLKTFPVEVRAIRRRACRAGLVAVVDADASSVEDRLRQFETSLAESRQNRRDDAERIALLVPKRNVETWVFHLLGNEVNEDDYKKRVTSSNLKEAVDAFADACPAKGADIRVPSLQRACNELTTFLGRGT
jgi:hypothetical protein